MYKLDKNAHKAIIIFLVTYLTRTKMFPTSGQYLVYLQKSFTIINFLLTFHPCKSCDDKKKE